MSNNETQNKMFTKSHKNLEVTEVRGGQQVKFDWLGIEGTYNDFEITVNGRFEFSVVAEVIDTNREELDVEIVKIIGEEVFEPKLRYESIILDALADYCHANEEDFRQNAQDWAEYYAELNADAARYM